MIAKITIGNNTYSIDLEKPLDLSLALQSGTENPNAWYVDPPQFSPVRQDDFVGSVAAGNSVNFYELRLNPHAHGTHTECLGHISAAHESVNGLLHRYFYKAQLITVQPESKNQDRIIEAHQIESELKDADIEALIIRTLPNTEDKKTRQYSHTNWPYLSKKAAQMICRKGIQHLLIDTPSVDREKDEGKLVAHRAFWDIDGIAREHATITEFVYAADSIQDGMYLLELQLPNIVLDAVPSRPILYALIKE